MDQAGRRLNRKLSFGVSYFAFFDGDQSWQARAPLDLYLPIWYAFEEGKVKVIGDEPANTDYHPGPSEKAVS
jgi:hypothetical protein